jgi:predicted nucleic acid-binding Zn ribbon protein
MRAVTDKCPICGTFGGQYIARCPLCVTAKPVDSLRARRRAALERALRAQWGTDGSPSDDEQRLTAEMKAWDAWRLERHATDPLEHLEPRVHTPPAHPWLSTLSEIPTAEPVTPKRPARAPKCWRRCREGWGRRPSFGTTPRSPQCAACGPWRQIASHKLAGYEAACVMSRRVDPCTEELETEVDFYARRAAAIGFALRWGAIVIVELEEDHYLRSCPVFNPTPSAPPARTCEVCGRPLRADVRSDAKTCSPRCRQAAHRTSVRVAAR